ncbi:hypothetical protein KJ866_01000 [Patescibacteria group bacterium]|nr:hypothetical protein [Patescibacteria group bacterium]MBU2219766.1 hypothetical protein [Patescibacteria group bacterium]MBU2265124.1 hypothetical protein [Patescibacteria group bacterium]
MIVGLLGLFDLHVAVLLCALGLGVEISVSVIIATAILLFAKACISLTDIGGLQDVAAVILILLGIFIVIPQWLLFIAAAIIGFKGLSSLAA